MTPHESVKKKEKKKTKRGVCVYFDRGKEGTRGRGGRSNTEAFVMTATRSLKHVTAFTTSRGFSPPPIPIPTYQRDIKNDSKDTSIASAPG
jgi:hypothetical protein